MIRVTVPATTANLGPGYDCLGLALDLYNTLELSASDRWQLQISGQGEDSLPRDRTNLVWRSMCRLWQETGTPTPVVEISIYNRIPLARGLGSSAAAIVGALMAANQWAGQPLSRDRLLQLACELEGHPDNVTPALLGGLCLSVLDGQRVATLNLDIPASLKVVACIPDFSLATQEARAVLPAAVSHGDAVFNLSRAALLVGAMARNRTDLLKLACQDRLHQDYRKGLIPGFDGVVAAAREAGALACVLSGAGPTLLALVTAGDAEAVGAAMAAAFAEAGQGALSMVLTPDFQGVRVERR